MGIIPQCLFTNLLDSLSFCHKSQTKNIGCPFLFQMLHGRPISAGMFAMFQALISWSGMMVF
jgi:hypothetical protein